jgi:hypothetical protein
MTASTTAVPSSTSVYTTPADPGNDPREVGHGHKS